ncbi:hypothetical protein ACN28S_67425 [Cystobacter fuscus]
MRLRGRHFRYGQLLGLNATAEQQQVEVVQSREERRPPSLKAPTPRPAHPATITTAATTANVLFIPGILHRT